MYRVTIHFTQATHQLMTECGRDVLLEARKIAKSVILSTGEPIQGSMEMRDTFAAIDTLGPPTGNPIIPALRLGRATASTRYLDPGNRHSRTVREALRRIKPITNHQPALLGFVV